jgi:hypothetical protein
VSDRVTGRHQERVPGRFGRDLSGLVLAQDAGMKSTEAVGASEKVSELVKQTKVDIVSPEGIASSAFPVPPFTSPETESSVLLEAHVPVDV